MNLRRPATNLVPAGIAACLAAVVLTSSATAVAPGASTDPAGVPRPAPTAATTVTDPAGDQERTTDEPAGNEHINAAQPYADLTAMSVARSRDRVSFTYTLSAVLTRGGHPTQQQVEWIALSGRTDVLMRTQVYRGRSRYATHNTLFVNEVRQTARKCRTTVTVRPAARTIRVALDRGCLGDARSLTYLRPYVSSATSINDNPRLIRFAASDDGRRFRAPIGPR